MMEEEISQIKSKYPRTFTFKDKGKIIETGEVEDVLLFPEGDKYLKGVEKLHFEKGDEQFRFMYWANLTGEGWRWGQFNVCMDKDAFEELLEQMKKKGWI